MIYFCKVNLETRLSKCLLFCFDQFDKKLEYIRPWSDYFAVSWVQGLYIHTECNQHTITSKF